MTCPISFSCLPYWNGNSDDDEHQAPAVAGNCAHFAYFRANPRNALPITEAAYHLCVN